MFHQFSDYQPYQFFVRLGQGEPSQTIGFLEETWSEIVPGYPFLFSFLEEDINSFYKSEERFSSILRWAGFISIFLACLGLFGLSALASLNRRKEIGIRKVLGASVLELVTLLSKDFVKLVLIAMFFSIPLAGYFRKSWFEEVAYHIGMEGWMFLAATIITLIIAFFTVGIQGLRAAWTHPVDSLRSE
jgi:putative ABC transport system permease protein